MTSEAGLQRDEAGLQRDSARPPRDVGGIAFPAFEDLPYDPYRKGLYTFDELHATDLDARIYAHASRFGAGAQPMPVLEALAQRIHDHAIDEALRSVLAERDRVVAIMGGHVLERGEAGYRDVAEIGRALALEGVFVASGGGPGAMEAANLGAWMAPSPDQALADSIDLLASAPDYATAAYAETALQVCRKYPEGGESLAIPTWFYGHEPTNAFATHIAKYFSNSLREDGLLAIATSGVVYAPGSAGTVSEIFIDATQNHYGTFHLVSPMVLFGVEYWTETLPAVPLLTALAGDRQYADLIHVTDSARDAVAFLREHPPAVWE